MSHTWMPPVVPVFTIPPAILVPSGDIATATLGQVLLIPSDIGTSFASTHVVVDESYCQTWIDACPDAVLYTPTATLFPSADIAIDAPV
jgi:hypothetical protein